MAAVKPLIAIIGPTASGKTAAAIALAQAVNGEIICADSRTVYIDMDIGTAKPTKKEQAGVPHWGIDLVEPSETFTVGRFQSYARAAIADIRARDKVPILVGGSGLYVDSIIFNFDFSSSEAADKHTWRHAMMDNTIVVGIATKKEELRSRIAKRTEHMFASGIVEEATMLGKKYRWDSSAMTGNIYPIIHAYLNNELTLTDAKERFTTLDWQLAKRQLTWFRPNPYIEWCVRQDVLDYCVKAARLDAINVV